MLDDVGDRLRHVLMEARILTAPCAEQFQRLLRELSVCSLAGGLRASLRDELGQQAGQLGSRRQNLDVCRDVDIIHDGK